MRVYSSRLTSVIKRVDDQIRRPSVTNLNLPTTLAVFVFVRVIFFSSPLPRERKPDRDNVVVLVAGGGDVFSTHDT